MRWPHLLLVTTVLLLGFVGVSRGEDDRRASLRGLAGVGVFATIKCEAPAFERMLTEESVKTKTELRLRTAGIRVYEEKQMQADSRCPSLEVYVTAVPNSGTDSDNGDPLSYAVCVRVAVNQRLWIVGEKGLTTPVFADTWQAVSVASNGSTYIRNGTFMKDIGDTLDEFVNDWLAAHQK